MMMLLLLQLLMPDGRMMDLDDTDDDDENDRPSTRRLYTRTCTKGDGSQTTTKGNNGSPYPRDQRNRISIDATRNTQTPFS